MSLITENGPGASLVVQTTGLKSTGHPEIRAEIPTAELLGEAEAFLNYVSNYLTTTRARLASGETMAYGYWMVKFQDDGQNILETWEYDAQARNFTKGVELALRYWREQHIICKLFGAEFKPPAPDKLTVVSNGVLEGLPVQGVRYPSPDHMSGWWITTDLYDGNIKNLKNQHTYHVTAARPDLAKYFSLPHGFRFDSATGDVWLDERAANGAR